MPRLVFFTALCLILMVPSACAAQEVLTWREAPGPARETVSISAECGETTIELQILNRSLSPSILVGAFANGVPISAGEPSLLRVAEVVESSRQIYFSGSRCSDAAQVTFWIEGFSMVTDSEGEGAFIRPLVLEY